MTEGGEQEIFAFDPADRPEGDDAKAFTLVSADEDNWIDQKKSQKIEKSRKNQSKPLVRRTKTTKKKKTAKK